MSSWTDNISYGDNIPNWKELILAGMNATTTMDGTVQRILEQKFAYGAADWLFGSDTQGWRLERRYETIFGTFLPSFSYFPALMFAIPTSSKTAFNRALTRFNEKAAKVNRQFQGGVFFAELHKTLHGVAHPAEALFKGIERYSNAAMKLRRSFVKDRAAFQSLSAARRRQVSKSFTKAATGLWLENSFHWLPLMGDIEGAVSAFAKLLESWPTEQVHVSAYDIQQTAYYNGTQSPGGGLLIPWSEAYTSGAAVRMYGVVRVGPRGSAVPDMKALGIDPASFFPTLWELVPYSWAIDYFTNIGDMIYGASYGGCDVLWASTGTKRFSQYHTIAGVKADMTPPAGWHNIRAYAAASPSELVSEKAVISRAPYFGNFIPFPEFRVPGLSLKWLNLGAAFLQRSLAFL